MPSWKRGAAFTAGVAGWETSDVPAYGSAAEWYTTAGITASTVAQQVSLATPQVYNANNGIKTYMKRRGSLPERLRTAP